MGYSETLRLVISGDAKGAIRALNEVKTSARATDAAVAEGAAASGAANQTLGQKIKANSGAIMAWGAVAATAGVIAVGAAKKAADSFADLGIQVLKVQRATGSGAGAASRLVAVLDDYNISGEKAAGSFAKMVRNIDQGKTNFSEYGIQVFRNADHTLNFSKTLESVATAYQSTTDAGTRSKMVMDVFGKSGRDLIPILEQGGDALRKMYASVPDRQIFSDGDVEKARRYKLAMDNLDDAMKEIGLAIGGVVAGPLASFANLIGDATRAITTMDEVTGGTEASSIALGATIGTIFPGIGTAAGATAGAVLALKGRMDELQASWNKDQGSGGGHGGPFGWAMDAFDSLTGKVDEEGEAQSRAAKKTKEHAQALVDETNAIKAARKEADTYINSQLGLSGALLNVESAQRTYAAAVQESGSDSFEARQAAQSLAESIVKVGMAQQAAGKSTQEQIASLSFLAGTLAPGSPLRVTIEGYIANLRGIPRQIDSAAYLDVRQAVAALQQYSDKFNSLPVALRNAVMAQVGSTIRYNLDGSIRQNAMGGSVAAQTPHLVGERGPELFIPGMNGSIIPSHRLGGIGGGGGTTTVTQYFTVAPGADVIGFGKAAREAIAAYERRAGMN